jgi:hypothetical protein
VEDFFRADPETFRIPLEGRRTAARGYAMVWILLRRQRMRAPETKLACLLEARFHRTGQRNEFIVVGYVDCEGPYVVILDAHHSSMPRPSRALLSNLKYIALMSAPEPYEFLRALESPFWSFVEIGQRLAHVERANDTGLLDPAPESALPNGPQGVR